MELPLKRVWINKMYIGTLYCKYLHMQQCHEVGDRFTSALFRHN